MKKTVLLITVFITSFLFFNCTTIYSILYGSTRYYNYDFVNNKNKTVIKEKNIWDSKGEWSSPEIIMENIRFYFFLEYAPGEQHLTYGKGIVGGQYYPHITISASEGKYIDHVLINRVVIYAGEIEYSMLERVSLVDLSIVGGQLLLDEEEMTDIRRTGFIDHSLYTDDDTIKMRMVFVRFSGVSIDFIKHKEIRMLFDISVEYTTGEIININQELIGLLKMNRVPRFNYFYIPILSA